MPRGMLTGAIASRLMRRPLSIPVCKILLRTIERNNTTADNNVYSPVAARRSQEWKTSFVRLRHLDVC